MLPDESNWTIESFQAAYEDDGSFDVGAGRICVVLSRALIPAGASEVWRRTSCQPAMID